MESGTTFTMWQQNKHTLRCLQWPQTLNATVGSVTSDFCFLRSAAAAAMHSCVEDQS